MNELRLSIAVGNYDRVRPLRDGEVKIDGVLPIFLDLEPEEIFFRAFRHAEFDVCEMSLSSTVVQIAKGTAEYIALPVYPSRIFRHTGIYIRTDRGIKRPEDLKGRRVGIPEYQLTACVWIRALLQDEYGVAPSDVTWVRSGIESPGRPEKIRLNLPEGVRMVEPDEPKSLSQLLADGDIDAIVAPRPPSCFERRLPHIGWLFPDPMAAAKEYFRRTGIFPIMHVLGVRRELVEAYPFLPASLVKAFTEAKDLTVARLEDNSAAKATLPWLEEQVAEARALMGHDFWSYGVESNRKLLDTFLEHHHKQGLSERRLAIEDIFPPSVMESVVI